MARKKEEKGKMGTQSIDFDNLLDAMGRNGIHTQKELSELTGIKQATISNWKNGQKANNGTIKDLSRYLGVPEDFLTGKMKTLKRFTKEVKEHSRDLSPAKQFIESLGYKVLLRNENGKEQLLFYSPRSVIWEKIDQVHPDGFYITSNEQIEFLLNSITSMTRCFLDTYYTSNLLSLTDIDNRIEESNKNR